MRFFGSGNFLHVLRTPDGWRVEGEAAHRAGASPADADSIGAVGAGWSWDGSRVTVRNCAVGFLPLYYYADGNQFCVASMLETLLGRGVPLELDDEAVAVFLRLGWQLGDDTLFRHVRVLPPATTLVWRDGELTLDTPPARHRTVYAASRDAALDDYVGLFREAVRRRLPESTDFALPLSGGRDSRHILAELVNAGREPRFALTTHEFQPDSAEDIRIARLLAEASGIEHVALRQPSSRIGAELRKNRLTDFGAMEHAWSLVVAEHVAGKAQMVFDGIGGDFLSGGAQLIPQHVALYAEGRLEALARDLLARWLSYPGYEAVLTRTLRPQAQRRFALDAAVARVVRELERHVDAPNPLAAFHFWNRARRCIALYTFGVLQHHGVAAATPYLDRDVLDFLLSLPTAMTADKRFHTEAIARAHPRLGTMPYESAEAPRIERPFHYRRLLTEAAACIATAGTGELLDKHYLAPRLLRAAFDRGSALRARVSYFAPITAVYLAQLEASLRQAAKRSRDAGLPMPRIPLMETVPNALEAANPPQGT